MSNFTVHKRPNPFLSHSAPNKAAAAPPATHCRAAVISQAAAELDELDDAEAAVGMLLSFASPAVIVRGAYVISEYENVVVEPASPSPLMVELRVQVARLAGRPPVRSQS